MSKVIYNVEEFLCGFPLVVILMFTHIFFTIKLKFPQRNILKGFKYMIKSDKKNTNEGISSFKSLMAVLASTLGTGNIIGVGAAIVVGGIQMKKLTEILFNLFLVFLLLQQNMLKHILY